MSNPTMFETLWTNITTVLTNVLSSATQVITWVTGNNLVFGLFAIGLGGLMIRWARKLIHFS